MSYCDNVDVPPAVWNTACSNLPWTLGAISEQRPTLLVFLRHLGCTFCRQALADLRRYRQEIEGKGVQLALVHMVDDPAAAAFFAQYDLGDLPRFSDPTKLIYRGFGLKRGGIRQLLAPSVWMRGFQAAITEKHGAGKPQGDGFQMPGVFLVKNRSVLSGFIHDTAADRPDYCRLADRGSL